MKTILTIGLIILLSQFNPCQDNKPFPLPSPSETPILTNQL